MKKIAMLEMFRFVVKAFVFSCHFQKEFPSYSGCACLVLYRHLLLVVEGNNHS